MMPRDVARLVTLCSPVGGAQVGGACHDFTVVQGAEVLQGAEGFEVMLDWFKPLLR